MWHRSAGLTMRKMCGELECPDYYMCQSHDLQCYPCNSYCNQTSHNFDAHICEGQCQDYIHDYIKHYVKAGDIKGFIQDSLQEKETLQFMMICVGVLIVITLVLIYILMTLICNRKRFSSRIENGGEMTFSKDNAVNMENGTAMDNPMMMIAEPTSHITHSSSNKIPSEDITLETQDFTGYDNLGMWKVPPEFCSKL